MFHTNTKINTSSTAKSRCVGDKPMSNSTLTAKKRIENYHTHQLVIAENIKLRYGSTFEICAPTN